ncbi:MAG TPA: hypothetical protein VIG97_03295 [Luteimonas sp.]
MQAAQTQPKERPLSRLEVRRQRWIRAQRLGRDEIADLPPHFDPGADYDVAPANEEHQP